MNEETTIWEVLLLSSRPSFTLLLRYPKYLSKRNLIKYVFITWKSKMEFFVRIYNVFKALTVRAKNSILDAWYVSDTFSK